MTLRDTFENIPVDMSMLMLILLVIFSAVGVIYTKHSHRNEFIQLQRLEKQRDLLNEEWGRLLLEQSTWGNPNRVNQQARQRLNMHVPPNEDTVVIKP